MHNLIVMLTLYRFWHLKEKRKMTVASQHAAVLGPIAFLQLALCWMPMNTISTTLWCHSSPEEWSYWRGLKKQLMRYGNKINPLNQRSPTPRYWSLSHLVPSCTERINHLHYFVLFILRNWFMFYLKDYWILFISTPMTHYWHKYYFTCKIPQF